MRNQSSVYVIDRGRSKKRNRNLGGRRAAGALIGVLLLLSAAICLLVVFLPKTKVGAASSSVGNAKTFYFLATGDELEGRLQALNAAQQTADRGGAGYVYNDGKYKIIAAVYDRESDVKTLVTVNAAAYYFSVTFPARNYSDGDKAVLDFAFGEWFKSVYTASTELERGNITEASAEHAVSAACLKLCALADKATERLKRAVYSCEYGTPQTRSVISYIRYITVKTVLSVYYAVSLAV